QTNTTSSNSLMKKWILFTGVHQSANQGKYRSVNSRAENTRYGLFTTRIITANGIQVMCMKNDSRNGFGSLAERLSFVRTGNKRKRSRYRNSPISPSETNLHTSRTYRAVHLIIYAVRPTMV